MHPYRIYCFTGFQDGHSSGALHILTVLEYGQGAGLRRCFDIAVCQCKVLKARCREEGKRYKEPTVILHHYDYVV